MLACHVMWVGFFHIGVRRGFCLLAPSPPILAALSTDFRPTRRYSAMPGMGGSQPAEQGGDALSVRGLIRLIRRGIATVPLITLSKETYLIAVAAFGPFSQVV